MRLIDADLFKKNLGVADNSSVFINMLSNVIDEQPTVIDTEKIIDRLEYVFALTDETHYLYENQKYILSEIIKIRNELREININNE